MIKALIVVGSITLCLATTATTKNSIDKDIVKSCSGIESEPQQYTGVNSRESDDPFTPFTGSATTVVVEQSISSSFFFPYQSKYFSFHSDARQFLSFNYLGTTASLKIYYNNFFSPGDYLTSSSNLGSDLDCYYFDMDTDYIIEITNCTSSMFATFSFELTLVRPSTFPNHSKCVLHQTFDSNSNVGFHYKVEEYNLSDTTYTNIEPQLYSYSGSTSYADVLDSTHSLFEPGEYYGSDHRKVVVNTGYGEFSAIAYGSSTAYYNNSALGYVPIGTRFTGTFVSENAVLTCAHAIFVSEEGYDIFEQPTIGATTLNKSMTFQPGINDYSQEDYYGEYSVVEAYASISYVLRTSIPNISFHYSRAEYDWAICITTNTVVGTRTHSCMGVGHLSTLDPNGNWSFARCAGYPQMYQNPNATDLYLYDKTLWASIPLENSVKVEGGLISANGTIIISTGNSGCPLYYKQTSIVYGQTITTAYLLGICSGSGIDISRYTLKSYFSRNSAFFINLVQEIAFN